MTKFEDFQRTLRETGAYQTSEADRAPQRAKTSWWTTLRYTWGLLRVFPICAWEENTRLLTTERWARHCFHAIVTAERLGMKLIVEGFENRLAEKGPVIYLCNHLSTTETLFLPPILLSFGPFSYVAKASLAHLPLLARAAEHMRMVPIERKSPKEDFLAVIGTGTQRIHGGDSFLIFPQGTRMDVFSRKRYSSIGAKLAEHAECPIVPIVVDTRCQPTRKTGLLRKIFKDFGPVDTSRDIRICCGPVIPAGKSKEMHEAAFDWMATKLESWGLSVER